MKDSLHSGNRLNGLLSCLIFGVALSASKSAWLALTSALLFLIFLERKLFLTLLKPLFLALFLVLYFCLFGNFFESSPYITNIEITQFDLTSSEANSASHRGQMYVSILIMVNKTYTRCRVGNISFHRAVF